MNVQKRIQIMLAALLLMPLSVRAGDTDDAKSEFKGLWNVDSMMEQAAANIGRRYNLNDAQMETTKKMLVEEVTKFLDTHDNIWPLVRDLGRYQIKGEGPQGDAARRIGDNALPLMNDIRETILRCNEDWGSILNEDQRKLHEWDLRDMEKTFGKMEENFTRMSKGESINPGIFPGPNDHDVPAPPVRKKPKQSFKPKLARTARESRLQEDTWEAYVQSFIKKYTLDDGQSESARSILRECKVRASAYRKSKDRDFVEARKRLQETRRSNQPEQIKKTKEKVWTQLLQNLRKPVDELFVELKDRLARLPTSAQRKRAGDPPTPAKPLRTKPASSKQEKKKDPVAENPTNAKDGKTADASG
ncbi:MAG: hypothetical protein GXP29_10525 [Planctomycetes bacterium]|nr:hypothetical protein [Planctomycetota bacterium]